MQDNLIFDVGMYNGDDTAYYLNKGYDVIAVDANPYFINSAKILFKRYLSQNRLVLLNYAISDKEGKVELNISKMGEWSSLNFSISNRESLHQEKIEVQSRKISSLVQEFGLPYYCKIDIEGYDIVLLKTMADLNKLPQFISVESECAGESETISEEQALATLKELYNLGYKKFKLIDQATLEVLQPNKKFYSEPSILIKFKERIKAKFNPVNLKADYKFRYGSSGPFGDTLEGEWLNYITAIDTLRYHRRSYFKLKSSSNFGFWCDWHAKLV